MAEPTNRSWDTPAHRERYGKVLRREMTLDEALREALEEHRHAVTELDAALLLADGYRRPAGSERWIRVDEQGEAI